MLQRYTYKLCNNIQYDNFFFRCSICKKIMTQNLEKKIKCMPSRLAIINFYNY